MSGVAHRALAILLTAANYIRQAARRLLGRKTIGAHAVALTCEGAVVLVKLRYAPGWRLPGGGRTPDEDPVEAALRELREEIGLVSSGEAKLAGDLDDSLRLERDTASLVVVRDVTYRPARWSWEVEEVREFPLDSLPPNLSPIHRHLFRTVRSLL